MSWLVTDAKNLDDLRTLLNASPEVSGEGFQWSVVVSDDRLFIFDCGQWTFHDSNERNRLSRGREILFFTHEEHVMNSDSACWRNGREVWSAAHDSDLGTHHLAVRGQLPRQFAAIKNARVQQQMQSGGDESGVDYIFSVPADLSIALTGYDPDEDNVANDPIYWIRRRQHGVIGLVRRLFQS